MSARTNLFASLHGKRMLLSLPPYDHLHLACYDYQHGHLCKHAHKVHSLRRQQKIEDEQEIDDVDLPDDDASVIDEDQSTAVQLHVPSKTVQDSAGI